MCSNHGGHSHWRIWTPRYTCALATGEYPLKSMLATLEKSRQTRLRLNLIRRNSTHFRNKETKLMPSSLMVIFDKVIKSKPLYRPFHYVHCHHQIQSYLGPMAEIAQDMANSSHFHSFQAISSQFRAIFYNFSIWVYLHFSNSLFHHLIISAFHCLRMSAFQRFKPCVPCVHSNSSHFQPFPAIPRHF